MQKETQFLIDTEIIIDYLNFNDRKFKSDLIKFLSEGKCFTTVLNATELYLNSKNKFLIKI